MEEQNQNTVDDRPLDEVIRELTEKQSKLESELMVAKAQILERDRAIKVLLNGNPAGGASTPADDFKKKLHI